MRSVMTLPVAKHRLAAKPLVTKPSVDCAHDIFWKFAFIKFDEWTGEGAKKELDVKLCFYKTMY